MNILYGHLAALSKYEDKIDFVTAPAPPVSTGTSTELEKIPLIEKKKPRSQYIEDQRDLERPADLELTNLDKGYGGTADAPDHGKRRDGF